MAWLECRSSVGSGLVILPFPFKQSSRPSNPPSPFRVNLTAAPAWLVRLVRSRVWIKVPATVDVVAAPAAVPRVPPDRLPNRPDQHGAQEEQDQIRHVVDSVHSGIGPSIIALTLAGLKG